MPKSLEERVVKRWDLLISRQAIDAYEYLTPGFRQTKTREQYSMEMNTRPVQWKKASVLEKKCETEDVCDVSVTMEFTIPVHGAGNTPGFSVMHEKWMKIDGEWLHLPEKLGSTAIDNSRKQ
ncbi:hypothetical protein [Tahibacter amnicola]|uniref:Nuclear transport factor 2 family protein n=1 Tax=Tahibacter amnicola TaxID=2976241 RepID=A0ABY6BGP9_9GAMM|nr:hypothetical protein [Tahibacter amnicola]UXI67781.1 hypothetical protein N4264_24110 [Tahibacter amnicola]